LYDDPLGTISGPNADAITFLHSEMHQAKRESLDRRAQFRKGEPLIL